jgi:hypothetical protein
VLKWAGLLVCDFIEAATAPDLSLGADEMDGPTAMDIVNETAEEVNELLCVIEAQQKHAAQMVEIINQVFHVDQIFAKFSCNFRRLWQMPHLRNPSFSCAPILLNLRDN